MVNIGQAVVRDAEDPNAAGPSASANRRRPLLAIALVVVLVVVGAMAYRSMSADNAEPSPAPEVEFPADVRRTMEAMPTPVGFTPAEGLHLLVGSAEACGDGCVRSGPSAWRTWKPAGAVTDACATLAELVPAFERSGFVLAAAPALIRPGECMARGHIDSVEANLGLSTGTPTAPPELVLIASLPAPSCADPCGRR